MIKQNYCELNTNTLYADMYDELLDEELNMNDFKHNDKIKQYLEKKIINSNFIKLSNNFSNTTDLMEDLILKISSNAPEFNLQGNTIMMYADDDSMYELFHMEDLTQPIPTNSLNEYGSLTNIFLQPICWTCGIFKSTYKNGVIHSELITKSEVAKLFIYNFYHIGIMIDLDGTIIELEFTGEDPYKIIGLNFTQANTIDLFGFNLVPWIEKITEKNPNKLNEKATKLSGKEIYGRAFFALVCPNTNKKFWNLTTQTINNIFIPIENKNIQDKILKELEQTDININPFYILKKNINR